MLRVQAPVGTVTLLFSDIEGSTRLWESHPAEMQIALARHDALMRSAIASANGYVFKTIGDAFCAAFATAPEALGAALAAQRAMVSESWPESTPIRVRMALHTGAVENRDDDYFGPPVNRVARLVSVGHGGQILISQPTYELVRDSLPAGAGLRELGLHRLKDLGRPEHILQILHPDLPSDFPALRSLDNPNLRHNLPQQLNNFVGREREISEVKALLSRNRLLTLTGAGGSGKTRLSLQVAADQLEEYEDGVWFVELAGIGDAGRVAAAVAGPLGLKEEAGKLIEAALAEELKSKRLLLIFDNCEHLLDTIAKLADTLIRQCPDVQILASSREGLGITGEQTYRVPSLKLPGTDVRHTVESLSQFEAVRLFLDRALMVQPDFQVTNQNAPALASLCVHLDGIPLAIELAAARVRSLSVEEIESKLDQRFRLLTGGSRTALPRQQTLRALVDWSYQMLSDLEKEALEQLSVFVGGWTLEMAERTCGDPINEFDLLDLVTALVDKSLANFDAAAGGRYSFYETIREFARDQLAQRPEAESEVSQRHAFAMAQFGMENERKLRSIEEPQALRMLSANASNLEAALAYARRTDDVALAAKLSLALGATSQRRGYPREGLTVLDELFATDNLEGSIEPKLHCRLLCERATLLLDILENESAMPLAAEAARIAGELEDAELIIRSANLLGQVALANENFGQARNHFTDALLKSEEANLKVDAARLHNNLGIVERRDPAGDKDLAAHHYREALSVQCELNHLRGEAETLNSFGVLEHSRGNYEKAAQLYLDAAKIETELDHAFGVAKTLSNFGEALAAQEEFGKALRPLAIAVQIFQRIGSPYRDHARTMLEEAALKSGSNATLEELCRAYLTIELRNAVSASCPEE